MDMSLISVTVILFLIMDSIGNVSSFLKLVEGIHRKRIGWIIIREMLIALGFMLIFYGLGEVILEVLHVSEATVRLASALILFLIAIKIIFPATNSLRGSFPPGEPFIIPLAVPLIAGPSLLATIMLFAHLSNSPATMIGSILIAWAASVCILWFAKPLQKALGDNGLLAAEKLTGMLLVMLSVQRFMEGYHHFLMAHK